MLARKGFTLIELLVVVVLIGILSSIAIVKFENAKELAYVTAMKSDLRNFALYEQNYHIDSGGLYFAGNGSAQGFVPTVGVTVTATADPGPPSAWNAIAIHNKSAKTCSLTTTGASAWNIACP